MTYEEFENDYMPGIRVEQHRPLTGSDQKRFLDRALEVIDELKKEKRERANLETDFQILRQNFDGCKNENARLKSEIAELERANSERADEIAAWKKAAETNEDLISMKNTTITVLDELLAKANNELARKNYEPFERATEKTETLTLKLKLKFEVE